MAKSSAQPAQPKVRQLLVEMPESGFRVLLYFNRFGVEQIDANLLVHFGFTSVVGEVLATYSALMPKVFLMNNRADWMQYLGQVGSAPESPIDISWRPPPSKVNAVEIVNALRVGRSGTDAEIRCYCVSLVSVIDHSRDGSTGSDIPAQALALLQTTLEQQQLLLIALIQQCEG